MITFNCPVKIVIFNFPWFPASYITLYLILTINGALARSVLQLLPTLVLICLFFLSLFITGYLGIFT